MRYQTNTFHFGLQDVFTNLSNFPDKLYSRQLFQEKITDSGCVICFHIVLFVVYWNECASSPKKKLVTRSVWVEREDRRGGRFTALRTDQRFDCVRINRWTEKKSIFSFTINFIYRKPILVNGSVIENYFLDSLLLIFPDTQLRPVG